MATTTPMMIRVQAKGGKFLADDIGGAEVTVRDARTGRWLGGGWYKGTISRISWHFTPTPPRPQLFAWHLFRAQDESPWLEENDVS